MVTELLVLGVMITEVLGVLVITGALDEMLEGLVAIGVLEVLLVEILEEVLVGTGVLEKVLEVLDAVDEDEDEEDATEAAGQSPDTDGTASGPDPISTRVVPQFAALAKSRF
jgi:hypothetical protein